MGLRDINRLTYSLLNQNENYQSNKVYWLLRNNLWTKSLEERRQIIASEEKRILEKRLELKKKIEKGIEDGVEGADKVQIAKDESKIQLVLLEEKSKNWRVQYRSTILEKEQHEEEDMIAKQEEEQRLIEGEIADFKLMRKNQKILAESNSSKTQPSSSGDSNKVRVLPVMKTNPPSRSNISVSPSSAGGGNLPILFNPYGSPDKPGSPVKSRVPT